MKAYTGALLLAALVAAWCWPQEPAQEEAQDEGQVLDPKLHHLGDSDVEEWAAISRQPEGPRLELEFQAQKNAKELALRLTVEDADHPWTLEINDRPVSTLRPTKERKTVYLDVPPGALRSGKNTLRLIPTQRSDDILVGELHLLRCSFRELLRLQDVTLQVADLDTGKPLAARLTIVDQEGKYTPIYYAEGPRTAVRDGCVYTRDGQVTVSLPPGRYTAWASRGTEWSAARAEFSVAAAAPPPVSLAIRREVDTSGWIACDTHIHTYTYSGHGDSTVEERLLTLAVEGVELAIATDHNHNTDYRPLQKELKYERDFTAVVGNEVTTDFAHLNAFPLDPKDPLPRYEYEQPDYVQIVRGIRERGAQVVILNHPRWPKPADGPFGIARLHPVSGEALPFGRFEVEAMEILNAEDDVPGVVDLLLADWFALWNHGVHIPAVGSSDSHTVFGIVGQGRTYLPSRSDDPARIDVDAACAAFRRGEFSASLGIFATASIDGQGMGSQVTATAAELQVELRIAAPSWIEPGVATVYVNGVAAASAPVPRRAGQATDVRLPLRVPRPPQDAWLACVVRGPAHTAPFWRTLLDTVCAITNPFYLDADGDGQYRSPRETAEILLRRHGPDPAALAPILAGYDQAVLVQAAALLRAGGARELAALAGVDAPRRELLRRYLEEAERLAAAPDGR